MAVELFHLPNFGVSVFLRVILSLRVNLSLRVIAYKADRREAIFYKADRRVEHVDRSRRTRSGDRSRRTRGVAWRGVAWRKTRVKKGPRE